MGPRSPELLRGSLEKESLVEAGRVRGARGAVSHGGGHNHRGGGELRERPRNGGVRNLVGPAVTGGAGGVGAERVGTATVGVTQEGGAGGRGGGRRERWTANGEAHIGSVQTRLVRCRREVWRRWGVRVSRELRGAQGGPGRAGPGSTQAPLDTPVMECRTEVGELRAVQVEVASSSGSSRGRGEVLSRGRPCRAGLSSLSAAAVRGGARGSGSAQAGLARGREARGRGGR